ncbi:MAG: GIY-YIG nuclease family protein [Methanomassiliicoccaceae archaeon]|nr:GIY-YIG nuclease family protein [Methanomassiliicoccaceae archaeon]
MIRKGTYILIFDMPETRISVGSLGVIDLEEGTYCYVGSAMNGLDQRIERHLSKKKKIRWHIDHLTTVCDRAEAFVAVPPGTAECELGRIVLDNGGSYAAKGFGCSDCKCRTHLFFLDKDSKERLRSDPRFAGYK